MCLIIIIIIIIMCLLNASLQVVELYCYSNDAMLTVWWNAVLLLIEMSVSKCCGGTRSPPSTSVVYQSAPEVDLWCRLISVGNAVLLRVEGRSYRTPAPAGFFSNPVSHESLGPDDHSVRICSSELFITSSLKTNSNSNLFSQLIQKTTQVTFTSQPTPYWLTS